ncbi:hypothetical protein HPB52_012799 [Rhipicephalus sanguineus]|uniref:CCHC-type domain-containing protein n=1 Tax=Rhipicephalus sanguineus TaxID=34632 RepID=A0A9D4PVY5_RHISA|nr:hypothetical protein HPB52_012799 [Rhipicephalus sanguineus]
MRNGTHHGKRRTAVVATPPAAGSVNVKVEPLEQPPFPPSSLTRLFDGPVSWPSGENLEKYSPEGTPSSQVLLPSTWSFPDYAPPCVQSSYGTNSAYPTPVYYIPYVNQLTPLQDSQLQPSVVASSFAASRYADSSGQQETRGADEFSDGQETVQDAERVECDRFKTSPDNMDPNAQNTRFNVDDVHKPRRRGSSPPVLRTDSPRTIAYCYERGLGDSTEKSGHYFASPSTVQGRIKGVPVFIQSKRPDGALLELHPVDLFVAVSMISGTAPSQYSITPTGYLLLDMPSLEGVNRLLQSDHLCGVEIRVSIPDAYQKSSSVIRGVPTSYPEEELLDMLRPQGVINVKRIVKYTVPSTAGEGEVTKKHTGKVVLTFPRSLERPIKVEIGEAKYKLREFVDRPARCYKCQRLGHVSRHCASRLRCKRCCGPHDIKECPRDRPRRCANCGGPHYPSYKGCRAYAQMLRSLSTSGAQLDDSQPTAYAVHILRQTLGLSGDDTNVPDADDAYDGAEPTFSDDAKLRRDVESLDELALKLEDLAATLRDALQRASAQSPSLADRRAQGAHYIVRFQLPIVAVVQETGCSPTLAGYSVYEGLNERKVAVLVAKVVTASRHDTDVTDIDHPAQPAESQLSYLLGKAEQAASKKGLVILGYFIAWHKSWGYVSETQKGKVIAREADRRMISLITGHTQPTLVGNSINRDSCPNLAFVKGVREARWENDVETPSSDHYCILRIQSETLPIGKRKKHGQAWLRDWEADSKTRVESEYTQIADIKSWVADPTKTKSETRKTTQRIAHRFQGTDREMLENIKPRYTSRCDGYLLHIAHMGDANPALDEPITT